MKGENDNMEYGKRCAKTQIQVPENVDITFFVLSKQILNEFFIKMIIFIIELTL